MDAVIQLVDVVELMDVEEEHIALEDVAELMDVEELMPMVRC